MKDVICLGDMCPIPLMKLKQCKELKNKGEQIKLVTDHSCSVESITVTEPMNGIWELFIEKL